MNKLINKAVLLLYKRYGLKKSTVGFFVEMNSARQEVLNAIIKEAIEKGEKLV